MNQVVSKMKLFFLFLSFALQIRIHAQGILINGYLNAADVRDEWTQLLVLQDNLDIRNYTLNDDNASTDCAQARIRFKNGQTLWQHLRAGTIIMLWHRPCSSNGAPHSFDYDAEDGYLELDATNTNYFDYPDIGTSLCGAPTSTLGTMFTNSPCTSNGGNSLNIAINGELLVVKDANGAFVTGLGHDDSPGTSWTTIVANNLKATMYNNTLSSGNILRINCDGEIKQRYQSCTSNCFDYSNSLMTSSSTVTYGLPNTAGSCLTSNSDYWRLLREPTFSSQQVPLSSYSGTDLSFNWTPVLDLNPSDHFTGYMVLRNTSNSFIAPEDGTTYTIGSTIGTATVVAEITSSVSASFTDSSIAMGTAYYYRVYAYRYGTDAKNGNSYHIARGRAYDNVHFVSTNNLIPLPTKTLSLYYYPLQNSILLNWKTPIEPIIHDYFIVERSDDNSSFTEVHRTNKNNWEDLYPTIGNNYYRIRQMDKNGHSYYSSIEVIYMKPKNELLANFILSENKSMKVVLQKAEQEKVDIEIFDTKGLSVLKMNGLNEANMQIDLSTFAPGVYILKMYTTKEILVKLFYLS